MQQVLTWTLFSTSASIKTNSVWEELLSTSIIPLALFRYRAVLCYLITLTHQFGLWSTISSLSCQSCPYQSQKKCPTLTKQFWKWSPDTLAPLKTSQSVEAVMHLSMGDQFQSFAKFAPNTFTSSSAFQHQHTHATLEPEQRAAIQHQHL